MGRAIITGTTAQGSYPVAVTVPETLTFANGHATFARKDAVMLTVYDGLYDTSGATLATLEVAQGEASATPVAPTATGTREKLYEVTVPAGASVGNAGIPWTTAVADRRRTTVPLGGIMAGGWSQSYSGSYAGQYRDNAGALERWDGTAWVPYPAPVTSTTGATAASGFTLINWSGRRRGNVVTINFASARSGANIPAEPTGNLADTPIGTLPSGWRPPASLAPIYAAVGDGFGDGECSIESSGVITIRSWSAGGSIVTGRNLRVTSTFVL
ncbi:hypothetical protein [Streptomyces scopuliridis]|uniref:hypothetical protein n=1 Tax=Streptomyces scopuliridis TaxID=452529 RepID=UPI003691E5D5